MGAGGAQGEEDAMASDASSSSSSSSAALTASAAADATGFTAEQKVAMRRIWARHYGGANASGGFESLIAEVDNADAPGSGSELFAKRLSRDMLRVSAAPLARECDPAVWPAHCSPVIA